MSHSPSSTHGRSPAFSETSKTPNRNTTWKRKSPPPNKTAARPSSTHTHGRPMIGMSRAASSVSDVPKSAETVTAGDSPAKQQQQQQQPASADSAEKEEKPEEPTEEEAVETAAAEEEEEDEESRGRRKEEEESAATRIQAVFRGHKARKSMKETESAQGQNAEAGPTKEELEQEFREDDKGTHTTRTILTRIVRMLSCVFLGFSFLLIFRTCFWLGVIDILVGCLIFGEFWS